LAVQLDIGPWVVNDRKTCRQRHRETKARHDEVRALLRMDELEISMRVGVSKKFVDLTSHAGRRPEFSTALLLMRLPELHITNMNYSAGLQQFVGNLLALTSMPLWHVRCPAGRRIGHLGTTAPLFQAVHAQHAIIKGRSCQMLPFLQAQCCARAHVRDMARQGLDPKVRNDWGGPLCQLRMRLKVVPLLCVTVAGM
jgi:hypothetical protein